MKFTTWLLAAFLIMPAQAAFSSGLVLQRAETAPVIDGALEDDCWGAAEWMPLVHFAYGDLAAGGEAALAYDGEYLYAAFRLDEPEPGRMEYPDVEVNSPAVWAGEILEWFIEPPDGRRYFQLGWNPAGSRFNARVKPLGAGNFETDLSWSPGWRTASQIGESGWTSEAAISFRELGIQPPGEGGMLRMNLCRTRQVGEREFSAVWPTGAGGFHQPGRFGRVSFEKYVEVDYAAIRGDELTVLVAHRDMGLGYGWESSPNRHLDSVLGEENVNIRTKGSFQRAMLNWPEPDRLAANHAVIINDVPATAFSQGEIHDLCRYVEEGGTVILQGQMWGWRHDAENSWENSPFIDYMPFRPAGSGSPVKGTVRKAQAGEGIFSGIPAGEKNFTAHSVRADMMPGAEALAYIESGGERFPFAAVKKSGAGKVIHFNWSVVKPSGEALRDARNRDRFFVDPYMHVFWQNLIEYASGLQAPYPAAPPGAPEPQKEPSLLFDILVDNMGDVFAPGGTLRIEPEVNGGPGYPYEARLSLSGRGIDEPAGRFVLDSPRQEISLRLPMLDRGRYTLSVEAVKDGRKIAEKSGEFTVILPLSCDDEFPFFVFWEGDSFSEYDQARIAGNLRSIGFTSVGWLGGILAGRDYKRSYRFFSRYRYASRLQEAGLNVRPVWYPLNYEIVSNTRVRGWSLPAGEKDTVSGLKVPDSAYPDDDIMPWMKYWLDYFGNSRLGRMPLTDGYAVADESVARSILLNRRLLADYGGAPAPGEPGYHDFLKWYFNLVADVSYFTRAIAEAYNPGWAFQNLLMPNSIIGHASSIVNLPRTASAFAWMSPDVYHYGEGKLYHKTLWSTSAIYSATDFGRLARPGLTGGQLANHYYEAFPEQVFAALTAGSRFFHLFSGRSVSIETDGRLDERFAEISRKTTSEAGRIGRALNHCERAKARVAMVYPQTTYVWDSYDEGWRPGYRGDDVDMEEGLEGYAEIDGSFGAVYLQRRYALKTAYHFLREAAGHVDILHDCQIMRGDLMNYDVVALAYAPQVEKSTIRALKRFVEEGGMLLVTTDSALYDEDNIAAGGLYEYLGVGVGAGRPVSTDYSDTRMSARERFSRGNSLEPSEGDRVLFSFPGGDAACVLVEKGRGEAVVLGMPLAGLLPEVNEARRRVVEHLINRRAALISRPANGEFSAITFIPERGGARYFMIANHGREDAQSSVRAFADESQASWVLADIVTGEKVPFTVEDGVMEFNVSCPGRWGRALVFLDKAPAAVAVGVSGGVMAGDRLMISVRVLGADRQPVRAPLPVDFRITDPAGNPRDDLSGVRAAVNGVYVFTLDWPVNALPGEWKVTASEVISGHSAAAAWESR